MAVCAGCLLPAAGWGQVPADDRIISIVIDPQHQDLGLYWKNDKGEVFGSIQRLKEDLMGKHKRLVFAMNGGMYKTDNSPLGLFIQQQVVLAPLDTASGAGNFYMKPNGVFYITNKGIAAVCPTTDLDIDDQIRFATQSGPMLLINGAFHPDLKKGSANVNIRNGVGVLPNNKLVFAMSKEPVNFYDFADFFKGMGCQNALYLDGFVSRMYVPEKKWVQTDGNFGVIIGVTVPE